MNVIYTLVIKIPLKSENKSLAIFTSTVSSVANFSELSFLFYTSPFLGSTGYSYIYDSQSVMPEIYWPLAHKWSIAWAT